MRGHSDVLSKSTRGIHAQVIARDQYVVARFVVGEQRFRRFLLPRLFPVCADMPALRRDARLRIGRLCNLARNSAPGSVLRLRGVHLICRFSTDLKNWLSDSRTTSARNDVIKCSSLEERSIYAPNRSGEGRAES